MDEECFQTYNPKRMQLIGDDNKQIKCLSDWATGSVYGAFTMKPSSNLIYQHKFKIIQNTGWIHIGIVDLINIKCSFHIDGLKFNYYAYSSIGELLHCIENEQQTGYGESNWSFNDIITMTTNLQNHTVCWEYNNDKYEEIDISGASKGYHFVCDMKEGSQIELVSASIISNNKEELKEAEDQRYTEYEVN